MTVPQVGEILPSVMSQGVPLSAQEVLAMFFMILYYAQISSMPGVPSKETDDATRPPPTLAF
jgi:hypothetical protein